MFASHQSSEVNSEPTVGVGADATFQKSIGERRIRPPEPVGRMREAVLLVLLHEVNGQLRVDLTDAQSHCRPVFGRVADYEEPLPSVREPLLSDYAHTRDGAPAVMAQPELRTEVDVT